MKMQKRASSKHTNKDNKLKLIWINLYIQKRLSSLLFQKLLGGNERVSKRWHASERFERLGT